MVEKLIADDNSPALSGGPPEGLDEAIDDDKIRGTLDRQRAPGPTLAPCSDLKLDYAHFPMVIVFPGRPGATNP